MPVSWERLRRALGIHSINKNKEPLEVVNYIYEYVNT